MFVGWGFVFERELGESHLCWCHKKHFFHLFGFFLWKNLKVSRSALFSLFFFPVISSFSSVLFMFMFIFLSSSYFFFFVDLFMRQLLLLLGYFVFVIKNCKVPINYWRCGRAIFFFFFFQILDHWMAYLSIVW